MVFCIIVNGGHAGDYKYYIYSANAMLILMASNPLAHFVYINGVHIN